MLAMSKNKKVIIADDSASVQLYYKMVFAGHNVTLLPAFNGREALDLCKKTEDIHLILLDIHMPEMDGITALKEIRKFNKKTKIVLQTALPNPEQMEAKAELGFNDYLEKPLDPEKVISLISEEELIAE